MNPVDTDIYENALELMRVADRSTGLKGVGVSPEFVYYLKRICNTCTIATLERLKEQKQWRGAAEEIVLMTTIQAEIDKLKENK